MADFAFSDSGAISFNQIVAAQRMPTLAKSLPGKSSSQTIPGKYVFSLRNNLQMFRIYACSIFAGVMQNHALWYLSPQKLECKAMCAKDNATVSPLRKCASLPLPATVGLLGNFRPEFSLKDFSFHGDNYTTDRCILGGINA